MAAESTINLKELDGTSGIIVQGADRKGVRSANYAGYLVRGAGDINGDGLGDLIVGVTDSIIRGAGYIGSDKSYVVFGSDDGFGEGIDLNELNGQNGFVINTVESVEEGLGGTSVDGAGDVNGDGIDDLIIGDYKTDPNGENSGTSYVVFGTTAGFDNALNLADLNGSNGFAIAGIAAGDRAGTSVSSAGDINNDGIDDLVIGAARANANGEESGESYVVFGTASGFEPTLELSALDGSNGFAIQGIGANDRAGISVSEAGDFNGDGVDDIVISSRNDNSDAVESYVVFGREVGFNSALELSSLDGSNGVRILGVGGEAQQAGDFNGDGIDDLIVDGYESNSTSYVLFGRQGEFSSTLDPSSLDSSTGFAINSRGPVNGAGDFNADGFDDVIVGGFDGGYVIFGAASGFESAFNESDINGLNGVVLEADEENARVGFSVSGLNDFNGDGVDDVVIGSTFPRVSDAFDPIKPNVIYVAFGQAKLPGAIALNDTATTDEDTAVTGNVLTNDTSANPAQVSNLRVTAVNGVASAVGTQIALPSGALLTLSANGSYTYDPNGQFERLNSDAFNVDEFSYTVTDGAATDTGTVTVTVTGITSPPGAPAAPTFDLTNLDGSNGFIINDVESAIYSNQAVSNLGDINGDGLDDLIVGKSVVFGSQAGFGGSLNPTNLDGSNGFTLTGTVSNSADTYDIDIDSVSGAGDINGDGINDFIVGDRGFFRFAGPGLPGRSYLIFGRADGFDSTLDLSALDGTDGFVVNGGYALGESVSSAGDINGDGFDDLIVGDPEDSSDFSRGTGESFVIFGKATGFAPALETADLDGQNGFRLTGVESRRYSGDQAGAAVDGAGDVNGDGLDDVIVGAPGGDESYLVFGNASGFESAIALAELNGSNGTTFVGEDNSGTGISVGIAGDINGDGLDDLIIGADRAEPDGNRSGASYVVFGSTEGFGRRFRLSSLNGTNGFRITGINRNDGVGVAVSGAGDINNDGIDDLIVGSNTIDFSVDFNERESGDSYVIFGSRERFGSNISLTTLDERSGFVIEDNGKSVSGAGDINGDGNDDLLIADSLPGEPARIGKGYVVFGPATSGPLIKAQPDAFTTDSDTIVSGNVFEDNSSGADTVPVGSTIVLNGIEITAETSVTLPSGALLTLRPDGTFDYDPNSQFNNLGSFDSTTDSFSYALTNGTLENTATVTITITGAFEAPTAETVFDAELSLADLDGRNGYIIKGAAEGDRFGSSLNEAGDVNGDGIDDLIFGTYNKSYVVFGSVSRPSNDVETSSLDGSNGFEITGSNIQPAVSGAGDINADGVEDLILGSFAIGEEASYVVFGSADGFDKSFDVAQLDGTNGFIVQSPDEPSFLVNSVSDAGDLNGDGIDDIIITASSDIVNPNSQNTILPFASTSYVVFGTAAGFSKLFELSSLDGSNGLEIRRGNIGFPNTLASNAGDINNDGINDLALTIDFTEGAGGQLLRESYVVFGSKDGFDRRLDLLELDGSNGFSITNTGRNEFGVNGDTISSAGDINGDGIDDLIIGTGESRSNLGYVIFGTATGFDSSFELSELDGSNGFAIDDNFSSQFKNLVSAIGDINNDGIDDLIVGSPTSFNSTAGLSYIIFGSSAGFSSVLDLTTLDGSNGFVVTGIDSVDYAGSAVSGAGDVNGDGISDLVIGAPGAAPNGRDSGESYVVFGRASVPVSPLNPVGEGTDSDDGITGSEAADLIEGLAGNDVLDGRQGSDTLDGGEGTDTALYQFDTAGVTVDLLAGTVTDGFGDTDTLISIENVIGSDFDDVLKGDDNNNNLTGRKGNDTLEGGLGADTLLGGNSSDVLIGGSGADSFLYVSPAEGGDTIEDFESGVDKLLIVGAVFGGGLSAGTLPEDSFFTGTTATSTNHRLGYDAATGAVLFDADGSGSTTAVLLATLTGGPALKATDISIL